MTKFVAALPPSQKSIFAIGKLTGNLYMRAAGPFPKGPTPWSGHHMMILIVPGEKNQTDMRPGQTSEQEEHQLDWLPEGTRLELFL